MELLRDRLLYDYNPENFPRMFSGLFDELKSLHFQGKYVPWLNINSIAINDDNKAYFVNSVKSDNVSEDSKKNIKALAKIMIGCYMRQGTNLNDLSITEDEWFKKNLNTIFSCIVYEDFDKEYFQSVLDGNSTYYSDYLREKRQAEQLNGAMSYGHSKVLSNGKNMLPKDGQTTNRQDRIGANMSVAFNPLLIGMTIAILAVITIMAILLN